jgi:alkanesulfonate monooxygenase SsuD/methylene tetrahydromethanopterin reductase-like flavin-dependent oxidoreductase (luciferase family)
MQSLTAQPIHFGIVGGFGPFDPESLVAQAVHAESAGFEFFSLPDHLHSDQPTLEPWTALAFAAAATERLVVMPNVLGLPYRAPAVTAKMAETLDRLSGGRLVLGLGVGGYDAEFAAFGLAVRTPAQKVAALGEAIRIIRGLWDQPSFDFDGQHHQVHQARIEPKPSHRIPIWTGAYGPKSLTLTATLADGWIPSLGRIGLDQAIEMRATVLDSLREQGRSDDTFTCATNLVISFGSNTARNAWEGWQELSGDSQSVAERLIAIGQAGFTVLMVALPSRDDVDRFSSEIIPLVRSELAVR